MKTECYYVKLSYATYGLIVKDGYVTRTPPIAAWMRDKEIGDIIRWIATKNGTIELVAEKHNP